MNFYIKIKFVDYFFLFNFLLSFISVGFGIWMFFLLKYCMIFLWSKCCFGKCILGLICVKSLIIILLLLILFKLSKFGVDINMLYLFFNVGKNVNNFFFIIL